MREQVDAGKLVVWEESATCCDAKWESAYARFETVEEEIAKSTRRFRKLGVTSFRRDVHVVELFCGRGSGLVALTRLGFVHVEGVDLSAELLGTYSGPAAVYVGDCRRLRFADETKDLVIVQGGLHHLPCLRDDLDQVFSEIRRVLKPGSHVAIVEPWLTPFLRCVHAACRVPLLRQCWSKLDALAAMIEHERDTYEQWLRNPRLIDGLLSSYFAPERRSVGLGKLRFVGKKLPR